MLVAISVEAEKFLAVPLKLPFILMKAGNTIFLGRSVSTIRARMSLRPEEN